MTPAIVEAVTRPTVRKSCRTGQASLEQRIKEICQTRVRYGYRRVHVLLRRDGWRINQKKTRRIYRELGLQSRNNAEEQRTGLLTNY
jgi:putative transposase